jgi:hypothetical protein
VIKQTQDYQHHFIFFHQPTLDALKEELSTWNAAGKCKPMQTSKSTLTIAEGTTCPNAKHPKKHPFCCFSTEF